MNNQNCGCGCDKTSIECTCTPLKCEHFYQMLRNVEAERKRILDSLPEYGLYNHKLHRHRWSKEGFDDCLSKVRNIILNTNN